VNNRRWRDCLQMMVIFWVFAVWAVIVCSVMSDRRIAFVFGDDCIGLGGHWEKSVVYIGHFPRMILLHTFSYFRVRVRGNSADHTYRRGKKGWDCPELLGTANSKNSHFQGPNWWDMWRECGQWPVIYFTNVRQVYHFTRDLSLIFNGQCSTKFYVTVDFKLWNQMGICSAQSCPS